MSSQPKTFLSPEEYLELERKAERKSEYYQGEMFAMAGASRWHGVIVFNVAGELSRQLKGRPCEAYMSDMRVKVSPTGLYTYPDVVVVCGEPKFDDTRADTLVNPTLIIEVLSDSTRDYDLGRKFQHYQTLPSLQEYLTVEQDRMRVDHRVRLPENQWLLTEFSGPEQVLELKSISCQLALSEIYDKVEWPA